MCAPAAAAAAAAAAAGVCLTFSLFVRVSLTLSPLTHLTAYICLPVFAYTLYSLFFSFSTDTCSDKKYELITDE